MDGNKQTAKGGVLEHSSTTANISDPSSEADEEPTPSTSQLIRHDGHTTPSWIDSKNELLKGNPFLIPNVLACLIANSSSEALFNYRLVGQHIWNELAVNAINEDRSECLRLVKMVGPSWTGQRGITCDGTVVVIKIKKLISTLREGRIKKSTLSRIYVNSSVTHFYLKEFLQLNGQNIRTLHYDGRSLVDLRHILQTCTKTLVNLSLWNSWEGNESCKGLFTNDDVKYKFPRLERLVIASGELMKGHWIVRDNNIRSPSREFLSHLFQASPNLKSLSARFYDSFILESGLSFKILTTLCIKFRINLPQLSALCHVGLKLKKLRLEGLFVPSHQGPHHLNRYTDPEWMEFRKILLDFLKTQANTLEYFAVWLLFEKWSVVGTNTTHEHDSPHEQWSSMAGFPRMPNLHTFILNECSGKIPKAEFGNLFPKLRNLEIEECRHPRLGLPNQPNIAYSSNTVQNFRGKPTMELAQVFPFVIELHVQNEIPDALPFCWSKLKHLFYNVSYFGNDILAHIRKISQFLVGISPEESEWIEEQRRLDSLAFKLTDLELPRSRPSIFDLTELETFEFRSSSYEVSIDRHAIIESAYEVLTTLGLSRMTHLKKMDFVLEQSPRPRSHYRLPRRALDVLANAFQNREDLKISTNCNRVGGEPNPKESMTKKWALKTNLDHHKSEWKEIDELFRDDPDIRLLGLTSQ